MCNPLQSERFVELLDWRGPNTSRLLRGARRWKALSHRRRRASAPATARPGGEAERPGKARRRHSALRGSERASEHDEAEKEEDPVGKAKRPKPSNGDRSRKRAARGARGRPPRSRGRESARPVRRQSGSESGPDSSSACAQVQPRPETCAAVDAAALRSEDAYLAGAREPVQYLLSACPFRERVLRAESLVYGANHLQQDEVSASARVSCSFRR